MTAAPIWHSPTPWPQPFPERVKCSASGLLTSNAELLRWDSDSILLMASSLPTIIEYALPTTFNFVILPDFQGMGLGTKFMEALCEMYLRKGYKMYIRTAADSLAYHFDKSPFWKAGPRNGKKGDVSNGAINGRNQNMHIVNSERYSYEYMGPEYVEKPHEELVLDSLTNIDMEEMRKMLKELQQKNYITVVHGKVKQSTKLNQICCELGIRTELLYTTTKGVSHIPKRHLKKMKLVSLKPGKRPVYRKVA